MKITHNKVGQNLNLVDSAKQGRADGVNAKATEQLKNPAENVAAASLAESARVELSPRAQEAKKIKELAMATPDVDEAKVAKFRQLIDEGKYRVDAKAIADKMVDEHLEF